MSPHRSDAGRGRLQLGLRGERDDHGLHPLVGRRLGAGGRLDGLRCDGCRLRDRSQRTQVRTQLRGPRRDSGPPAALAAGIDHGAGQLLRQRSTRLFDQSGPGGRLGGQLGGELLLRRRGAAVTGDDSVPDAFGGARRLHRRDGLRERSERGDDRVRDVQLDAEPIGKLPDQVQFGVTTGEGRKRPSQRRVGPVNPPGNSLCRGHQLIGHIQQGRPDTGHTNRLAPLARGRQQARRCRSGVRGQRPRLDHSGWREQRRQVTPGRGKAPQLCAQPGGQLLDPGQLTRLVVEVRHRLGQPTDQPPNPARQFLHPGCPREHLIV